jgi:uncharacterized protein (DUF1330 family)
MRKDDCKAAYLVGMINVKDPLLWAEYVNGVSESLVPFGGRIIFRGEKAAVLAGDISYRKIVVLAFSSQQALQEWFLSEAYQALIPLRDRAAEVVIVSYDEQ